MDSESFALTVREELARLFQQLAGGRSPRVGDSLAFTRRGWELSPANLLPWRNVVDEDYTVDIEDSVVIVDASSVSVLITLPPAASAQGRVFWIKKVDSSSNTVTIDPVGSDTIDGASAIVTSVQYEAFTLFSDGVDWWII